jgi:hypothetical protein
MKYYIQRHASGYVGNCLLWWRKGGHGYTCDLDDAEVFESESEAFKSASKDKSKYTAWEKHYVDSVAQRHAVCESLDFKKHSLNKE